MKKRFLFLYLGILFPFSLLANDNIINEVDSLIELINRQRNNVEIQSSAETAYLALNKSIEADYSRKVCILSRTCQDAFLLRKLFKIS